jgi:hypothetical protein
MSDQQEQQPQSPYGQPQSGQLQWNQQPPPNQPAPQPPKKRGVLKWVLIGVGIALVTIIGLCALISAGINSAVKTATTGTISSTDTPSSNSSAEKNSTGQAAKVGQTITVNDVACTLVSVKHLAGDDIVKPSAGNEFIIVHVKLVNNGSSDFSYSSADFHAVSGSGNVTNSEVAPSTYTANNLLNSYGTLTASGKTEGDIILQVPIGDHKAQLSWKPSLFSNSIDNVWDLGL